MPRTLPRLVVNDEILRELAQALRSARALSTNDRRSCSVDSVEGARVYTGSWIEGPLYRALERILVNRPAWFDKLRPEPPPGKGRPASTRGRPAIARKVRRPMGAVR